MGTTSAPARAARRALAKFRITREEHLLRTYEVEAPSLYDAVYAHPPGTLTGETNIGTYLLDSQRFTAEEVDEKGARVRAYDRSDLISAIAQRL